MPDRPEASALVHMPPLGEILRERPFPRLPRHPLQHLLQVAVMRRAEEDVGPGLRDEERPQIFLQLFLEHEDLLPLKLLDPLGVAREGLPEGISGGAEGPPENQDMTPLIR